MPDFSDPKYANYREFAREVAIPRIPQDGDYFVQFEYPRKPIAKGPIVLPLWRVGPWPDVTEYGFSDYWLPTLTDWLEMLAAAGMEAVTLERINHVCFARGFNDQGHGGVLGGPTHEEAAGRLWKAIRQDG